MSGQTVKNNYKNKLSKQTVQTNCQKKLSKKMSKQTVKANCQKSVSKQKRLSQNKLSEQTCQNLIFLLLPNWSHF
jgi:hypothetical protein